MELKQTQLTLTSLGCMGHRLHVCGTGQGLPGPKIVGLTQWDMARFIEHKQKTGHNWKVRKERAK